MTVEKLKNFEPLFGSWTVESKIAEGRHSKVFKVAKAEDGQVRRQCLKTIKFPSGNDELNAVISSGIYQNVQQYLDEVELSVKKNMDKMLSLRGNKNIVRFDNYTIIKEKSCFYLVILMELLKPLNEYLKADSAVQNDVIRIGADICCALEGFRESGIIHHEIKPENIYVDSKGNFKLGDFGVCKGRFGEDKIVSSYIAPELYNNGTIDISSDIYSLGIMLYKLLNNNRLPFLPQYPAPVSLTDREYAFERRMRGDLFPAPSNASVGLANVIFKATAFRAHERYTDPSELLRDLEANYIFAPPSAPAAPPAYIPPVPLTPVAPSSPAYGVPLYNEESNSYDDNYDEKSEFDEAFAEDEEDSEVGEKVNKKWYFIIVALVVILAVAIGVVAKGGKEKETTTTTTTQAITFAPDSTTVPTTTQTTSASTTESTTESTTVTTTESTTVTTTVDTPSAVTTTTDPNTTKATQASTTAPSTTESTTAEPTTEPVYVEPDLFYNFNVEGAEDMQGRVYTSVNGTVTTSFGSGRDATVKIEGLSGSNAAVDESRIYIYTLDGARTVSKSNVSATLVNGSDGSISCFVTANDESFTYDPESYQYFVCIEEEAIKTDKAINLGLQVRV